MPFRENKEYRPAAPFRNPHINTLYSALLRRVELRYERHRLLTPDGDFLDLDFSRKGNVDSVLLVLHGLEGSAQSTYVKGLIRYYNAMGWDGVALNFRSCSGVDNWKVQTYHMAATCDVDWVLHRLLDDYGYRRVFIAGFSLGGNVLLNYLAQHRADLPVAVLGGAAVSVPCHIPSANRYIERSENALYYQNFMRSLNQKLRNKQRQYPEQFPPDMAMPRTFQEFDDVFTAPVHGFGTAEHYYEQASSLQRLTDIRTPVLMLQARDDTFLSPACYPGQLAADHQYLHLELTTWGGHVGFCNLRGNQTLWSERRIFNFMQSLN